ncbi:MAG: cysteine desulfurase family protein [Pseudomonadota bacterium]
MVGMIYADHNATSALRPEARDAMLAAMDLGANPSSVHAPGRAARKLLERARDQIGAAIGSAGKDIVFTSGGTEANRLALVGAMMRLCEVGTWPPVYLYSRLEHSAVLDQISKDAGQAIEVNAKPDGKIDLAHLRVCLEQAKEMERRPVLALMLANNETGVIQPVTEAAAIVREFDGLIHCDAVQALGKIPVNVLLLGVDYLALSGHKCGGPAGVGALWIRPGAPLLPLHGGGGQERSLRSGTENLSGIAGFGAAAEVSVSKLSEYARLASVRDEMEAGLRSSGVTVFGATSDRLANTSCFAFPGFRSETQVMAMDLAGVAISAGAACSSGKVKVSGVLQAMGVSDDLARSAIRVSFGWNSAPHDGKLIADKWLAAAARRPSR